MVTGLSGMHGHAHTRISVLCAQGYEEAHCTDRRRDMHQQNSHGKLPYAEPNFNMFLQHVLSGLDAGSWRDSPHG